MKLVADILRSYAVFDEQGRHTNGTDKESNHHYGWAYESLFFNRDDVNLVLEIGITDGSCMLAWREVFPNALIVGLDIEPSACQRLDRLEFHLGDQRVKADCERAAAGRKFDVIIEDAFHSTDNTLLSLFWLWPFVKPGGIYVIEEWANICSDKTNVLTLWPSARVINTIGPSGGTEPLVVLRKAK